MTPATAATTPTPQAPEALGPVKTRRRPVLIIASVAALLLSALGGVWLWTAATSSVEVVVAKAAVPRGAVIAATALFGPIAASLVELFPTRIRYTAMSLPYHVGIGWFGGFLPATTFAIVAATGDIYSGLWYPVGTAAVSAVICLLFMKETRDVDIHAVE